MSVTTPRGFRAAGVTAGLKASGRPDVALVVNDGPDHHAAAVFTGNRVEAAPVTWSRTVVADGRADAVLLNSGGANACTGAPGFQDTHRTAEHVGAALDIAPGDVVVCSTGTSTQSVSNVEKPSTEMSACTSSSSTSANTPTAPKASGPATSTRRKGPSVRTPGGTAAVRQTMDVSSGVRVSEANGPVVQSKPGSSPGGSRTIDRSSGCSMRWRGMRLTAPPPQPAGPSSREGPARG